MPFGLGDVHDERIDALQREVDKLKAEAEVREALLKDAYELLGGKTFESRGVTLSTCTMPERAVLDALFALSERTLRYFADPLMPASAYDQMRPVCAAELARRGLV